MSATPLPTPVLDPSHLFEMFRGNYATELLTAAVAHFQLFGRLAKQPLTLPELARELGLAERPALVLTTALRAFHLLRTDSRGRMEPTDLARDHLTPGAYFDVGDYFGLAAQSPGVLEMVERLRTNRPAGSQNPKVGAAFIYREGVASAMEQEASARHFTLSLAGRAKNVAPVFAQRLKMDQEKLLLDVGGGSGIYSIALLRQHGGLRAILVDRPEVLKVARDLAETYGVANRLELHAADMFADPLPGPVDLVLLSNVLHDWDVPECEKLLARCAAVLHPGGRLLIHDVFMNDEQDGPLAIALYSAALFCLTEGRVYAAAEYADWFNQVGLKPHGPIIPTLIHCGILEARKPS